jgi:hypothetical protein
MATTVSLKGKENIEGWLFCRCLGAPLNRTETTCQEKSVCVRCREHDALEYPAGHCGQLCGECENLQKREHVTWEAEKRSQSTVGRSTNQNRGF